jgi:AcrR family transcriptional regulator
VTAVSRRGRRPASIAPALTREDVMDAALRLFRQRGYAGTSLKLIGDQLGVSAAALYYYFPSKHDLFIASIEAGHQRLLEVSLQSLDGASAADRVREYVTRGVHQLVEAFPAKRRPSDVHLTNEQLISQLPPKEHRRAKAIERTQANALRDLISAAVDAGEFAPVNVSAAAFAITGMIDHLGMWYHPDGELTPDALAELFGDLAIKMLT